LGQLHLATDARPFAYPKRWGMVGGDG
jgi:hypothetical protein